MALALRKCLPQELVAEVEVTRLGFDRDKKAMTLRDDDGIPSIAGLTVLLVDSAVHSGSSMRHVTEQLIKDGAKCVLSYTLVLKRTSEFIPSFFGLLIDEHDRAFFQLEAIPNNRLHSKRAFSMGRPLGQLRLLRADDVDRKPNHLDVGVPSIDKVTFADLYYGAQTASMKVYVYEIGNEICAFIAFKNRNGTLFVDTVATDKKLHGAGIGGLLMRWAESVARSTKCTSVELWAIEERMSFYKVFGYEPVSNEVMNLGEGEKYAKMIRRILYNVKPHELTDAH